MANNKPAVLVLLLAFLFLLTAPLVLILGYSVGLLQLPQVNYRSIAIAATAGLFIIPVIFVFLAAVIIAIKKQRRFVTPSAAVAKPAAKREPARYPWEGMFGPEEKEQREKRRAASKPLPANFKAAAGVVIVIALVVLVLLLAKATQPGSIADANKTAAAKVAPAETPSNVTVSKQNVLSRILAQVFAARNATNETQARQDAVEKPAAEIKPQRNATSVSLSGAAKNALGSIKSFGGKLKGKFAGSASKVKFAVAKVPDAVWQKVAIAAVALLVVGTIFYSHRTSQLGEIPAWFLGWQDWLKHIFAAAWKNKARVILAATIIFVAAGVMAAFVFRKKFSAKLPDFSLSAVSDKALDALFAVRDFVLAYRLYILIGIFALLAIIGILFVYETRGKKKEN